MTVRRSDPRVCCSSPRCSSARRCAPRLAAQVTPDRLLRAAQEPQNWLTYSGGYASQRYTTLRQVTPLNVRNLEQKWVLQGQVLGAWQSTPLVVDGIMYVTQRPNDVLALDAKTGRVFWQYRYANSPDQRVCCGANNRGVAIHGETLFMGTLDAHLVAIDAKNGQPIWNIAVADSKLAYSVTLSPLVIKDKVIIGVGGAEYGIRGFVAAYDVSTGKEAWRFETIPRPGQKGSETWAGNAWEHGGGSIWVDRLLRPRPQPHLLGRRQPRARLESRISAPATTSTPTRWWRSTPTPGALKWHFQFTPNDAYDYDAVQVPVLADMPCNGAPAKADAVGQPQRLLLRAGSRHRQVPARQPVRESELGERPRRERPPDPDAAAAGLRHLAGQPGRHQLVLAVVQPAHGALLRVGLGGLRVLLPARAPGVRARPQLRRRRPPRGDAGARRARQWASAGAARSTTGPTPWAMAR